MFESLDDLEEEKPKEKKDPDYTGVIVGVCLLPVFFYFRHMGKTDLGLNVGIWLAVNIIAIKIRWDLRKCLWFWLAMIFVLALESPLVLKIQWPHHWVPGVELLPIGLAGYLIAIGAIRLAEKLFAKEVPEEGA